MSATLIPLAEARVTTTPNATMTTLASPTHGGTDALSLWRVVMAPGQRGPVHVFDVDQVWLLLDGAARVTIDGEVQEMAVGDCLVIGPGAVRRISTQTGAVFVVAGAAHGLATPVTDDGAAEPVAPAWIL